MYYRNRMYHAELGRFVSRDPVGYATADPTLYRYVRNRPTGLVDPLGLLGVKCVGEGMQFFTRQFGTSAGLAQFWWGIALYADEKGQVPTTSGTVIMRRKLNLDYTTCGTKTRYRHDEEGWFLHPFSPNDIGKKPHHVGLAGMEDGTVALAVMDISFGPGASFFTGARPGPRGVATREDAMCSRGRLDVVVDFRVYAADISREGFGPNRKFEPAGMDSFRDVWSEYNRKGYAADVEPAAWKQEPMSHKSVNVAIRWDCCSNAKCTFEAAGDAVPGGPQRLGHTAAESARLCRSPEHRGNWQCE